MDFTPSPAFLARHADTFYIACCVSVTLIGGVVTYGPRIFAGPAVDKVEQEIGEFIFENGILLPHKEYLYEFSETGEPYILGKKLPGIDYSATEAGYAKSMGMESHCNSTWSEWFGESKIAMISYLMQPLLWFLFGILCALVIRWAWPKLTAILSKWKHSDAEDTLSLPTSAIEEEYSKLNNIWRSTLISMYQEKKSEVEKMKAEHAEKLSEQQRDRDSLRRMLDTEIARAQNLENSNHATTAENATANETIGDLGQRLDTQTARVQTLESSNHAIAAENSTANKTIEDLRQMMETQTARAQNQESSIHAVAAENATANETIEDLRQRLHTETTRGQDSESTIRRIEAENATALHTVEVLRQRLDTETTRAQDSESTNRRIEAENTTAKETIKDLKERFEALQSRKEAESDNAKQPLGGGQPEPGVVPKEATVGDQDTVGDHPVGKLEGEDGMAEAVRGDGVINNESAGPKVGKKGKPMIPRANTRGDGSVRTPSHPNYVPLEDAPSRLGDRPIRGPGRGNGWNPQRGGGGFGWRGGRGGRGGGGGGGGAGAAGAVGGGGRGRGGAIVRNGQSNFGRGQ